MTNHALLDNVTHKDLRINKQYSPGHGYDVNVARVFPVEFQQLQNEYPLFFTRNPESGSFEAVALLGFSEGENLYLGDDGWDASYVPLTIERQPFLIGFQQQDQDGVPTDVPVVHVDLDHPSVSQELGTRVFLEHGGESPLLERATSMLLAIHRGHETSQSFSQLLVGLDLIESLEISFELADGSKETLTGLYTINEDKLDSLNANALETLHRQGYLRSVYMMVASIPNLARLIERKNRMLTT